MKQVKLEIGKMISSGFNFVKNGFVKTIAKICAILFEIIILSSNSKRTKESFLLIDWS